jgi:Tol biopolymer transport system component
MALIAGTRLGPYEIVAAAGAGGMGEVYRARDTRLDRTVAIKVLSAPLAADPDLRQRFEREARAISALHHPHICTLFDIGEAPAAQSNASAVQFLVLEYLEGQTLAQKLAAGPLPVDSALTYAMQIADALDKAHRAGIVHRDLKPANVMITKAGAKLLDFGLAKTAAPIVATSGLSMLPTTPPGLTAQGTILGTFQYMAPEQIEGLDADARTDVFAFGALLFEMLTGRTAFEGKTRAALLGAILKDEPPRVSTLVSGPSPALDRVIATCLAKDPDDRYQTARDLLRDLKWAASPDAAPHVAATPAAAAPSSSRLAWSIAAVSALGFVAAATVAVRDYTEAPQRPGVVRFSIPPLENRGFGGPRGPGTGLATQIAVSPDGRSVAFVTGSGNGNFDISLRRLDALTSVPVPGTDGASFPFWSPDGTSIAFFAEGKLKRVAIGGGPAVVLCDAPMGRGGTWAPDGTIVFAPAVSGPLHRVSSAGGNATPVSTLDASYGELGHRFPRFLPDGRALLFTAVTGAANVAPKPSTIKWMTLESGTAVTLVTTESQADYISGHLLFQRDGILMAQPFDPAAGRLHGDPFPIAEDIGTEGSRLSSFSAASTGTLVYATGGRVGTRLSWTNRSGNVLETVGEQASYTSLSLSPDDRRAAVALTSGPPLNRDVWVIDLTRSVMTRLTFQPGEDSSPAWSPDGTQLVFQSMRTGAGSIRSVQVGGTAVDELLIEQAGGVFVPSDWSSDGRHILYTHADRALGAADLWALRLDGDRKPLRLTETPFNETFPVFSPDGRWFAYVSDESQDNQVYVQPFPPTGRKYLVSRDGGSQPLWRRDGRELYFLTQDATLYGVPVVTAPEFEAGIPQRLFASPAPTFTGSRAYDVSRDGQRFLFAAVAQVSTAPLHVVLNWSATAAR